MRVRRELILIKLLQLLRKASILLTVLCCSLCAISQCPDDNVYIGDLTPDCPGESFVDCIFGGEYVTVFVIEGLEYTFSTCGIDEFDTELTILDDFGTTVLGYNDDFCGDQSTVVWVADYTGIVLVLVDEHGCDDRDECANLTISCGDPGNGGGGGGDPNADGCNTDVILCQNTAGPFNFSPGGPPVGSCQDFLFDSQFTYILVNITTDGPLNLLIDGDATEGFLDVSVFDIPEGIPPCVAIEDNDNEIGCNYASAFSGCNQFGTFFNCDSSVPSPQVTAGQTIMIVVEDWGNGPSNTFNLYLGPPPNAQSGPPDPTILTTGPYCVSSTEVQLTASDAGGTWTGTATTPDGLFDPSLAGLGTHIIDYSIGQSPCTATSTGIVSVIDGPEASFEIIDTDLCAGDDGTLFFQGSANGIVTFLVNGTDNYSVQLDENGEATFLLPDITVNTAVELLDITLPGNPPCSMSYSGATASINVNPLIITSPIGHQ